MIQIKCPNCRKRVFDIGGIVQKVPVIVELKCPHCRTIVKIICNGNN